MNEKEHLIITYLANQDAPSERAEPGHYYIADFIAVAEGSAAPELMAEVEAHCKECELCRVRIEVLRSFAMDKDQDFAEMPLKVEGTLLEFAVSPPKPKPLPEVTPPPMDYEGQGFTNLYHSKNPADRELLIKRLRPWLPALFPDLELDDHMVEEFLATIPGRPALAADQKFRDVLPLWLAEFLGIPARPLLIDITTVGEAAVILTIRRQETNESDLAKKVRQFVLAHHPQGPDELEQLHFPDEVQADPWFAPFTNDLFAEVRRDMQEGRELFELAAA